MSKPWAAAALLACTSSLLFACKAREEAPPPGRETAPPPSAVAADAAPQVAAPPEAAPVDAAPPLAESPAPAARPGAPERPPQSAPPRPAEAGPRTPVAAQTPKAAAAAAAPAPPPATPSSTPAAPKAVPAAAVPAAVAPAAARPGVPGIADPGGEVAVTPGKAGLTRIGAEKCKLCHKLQYTSWADSGHARRKPALDCESCHGPGSEYKTLAVMKDPAKAKAAGLVEPGAAFCGKCHSGAWDPALLSKVHAHKAAG